MGKLIIKLTESDLHRIVKESVNKVLEDIESSKNLYRKKLTESQHVLQNDSNSLPTFDLQKTYPPISALKDGIYAGYRYANTFELENGKKYYTPVGIRCSKKGCGGMKKFRIEGGQLHSITN